MVDLSGDGPDDPIPQVEPRQPRLEAGEHVPADRAGLGRHFVGSDASFSVRAQQGHDRPLNGGRLIGDVDQELVHADAAHHWAARCVEEHAAGVPEGAPPAIGVAHWRQANAGRPFGAPGEPVADSLARFHLGYARQPRPEREHGAQSGVRRVRREYPVEGEACPHAVVPERFAAQGCGRVCGVPVRDPRQAGGGFGEEGVLPAGKAVVGFVTVRHVGRQPFDDQVWKLAKGSGERHRFLQRDAEAVQAGIHLDVHQRGAVKVRGRLGQRLAECERVAGEGDAVRDRQRSIGGEGVAEDDDRLRDPRLAQSDRLARPDDGEAGHAEALKFEGESGGASSIGVRLDDGNHIDRIAHRLAQRSGVVGEGAEVDLDPGVQRGGCLGDGERKLLRKRQVGLPFPERSHTLRSAAREPSIEWMAVCSKPSSRRMLLLALGAMLVGGACGGSGSKPPAAFFEREPTPVPQTAIATPYNTPVVSPTNAAEALAFAREVLREGRYEEAAAIYSALAAISTSGSVRAQALVGSSIARYSVGDREGALVAVSEAARAAPEGSQERLAAGYLLGVRLNEGERFEEAVVALAKVMSRRGALAPYVAAEYGHALSRSGRAAEAAVAWDALLAQGDLPAALRLSVLRERAVTARTMGDDAALARWLDALIGFSGDASALFERAQLARASGENAVSAQLLTRLVTSQSGSRFAVQAVAQLHEARVAVDAGQEGLIYYRGGAYPEARVVLLAGIAEPGISSATLAFRLYYLAAAYEDAGVPDRAIVYYDEAAAAGGSELYTHRAKYWAARATERSGDVVGAGARYRALVSEGPSGEFTAEASFRGGYTLFSAGDAAGAVAAWDSGGAGGGARVAYWKGRALATLGRVTESGVEYQRAIALGPLDFHGSEAARELKRSPGIDTSYRKRNFGAKTDWDVIAAWLGGRVPGAFPGSAPTAAAELAWVGLREQAAGVLNDAAVGAGAWRLLELAREAQAAGVLDVSAQLAVRVRIAAGVGSADAPKELLRVIYPVDYVSQLDAEAKANNLDPLFLAALVRQESFWDPAAGSGAGALGLTQVIPETGRGIARALDVRGFVPADLFLPAVSLRFGAYYLAGQVKRFGEPWAALSAYNAGPGNAVRWQEATGRGGAADFVEQVDFEETAHYVAAVLEHYAHYVRAYSE